jgi:hypothetical protein
MSKKILLSGILCVTILFSLQGQNYNARAYWKMEHDSAYMNLINRQQSGLALSQTDQSFLDDYKIKLAAYFEKMTDSEKSEYYRSRSAWNERPATISLNEEDQVYSGERSTYTKYIVSSGIWGALYGGAIDYILGVGDAASAGIPLITGGIGALIPVITVKDKKVSTNSLLLSLHGKAIGAFQGAMFGMLLTGEDISNEGGSKLTVGIATASSIALGRIGYNLGKTKDWSQGRVKLYSHYGWLMPFETIALVTAFNVDNPRAIALSGLAGGAAGYFIADKIAGRINFTRGDIVSMQTFTILNAGLGLGIMSDANSDNASSILIPAAGAMAGTLLGQAWMKNANLTNQQGRNIALTTAAGSVIGFGIDLIAGIDSPPFTYVIPYLTGLISYAIIADTYRVKNSHSPALSTTSSTRLHFSFMPQNILLNNKLVSSGKYQPGGKVTLLPAFAASFSF